MTATTLNPKSPDGLLISRFIESAVTDLSQIYIDSYKEEKVRSSIFLVFVPSALVNNTIMPFLPFFVASSSVGWNNLFRCQLHDDHHHSKSVIDSVTQQSHRSVSIILVSIHCYI